MFLICENVSQKCNSLKESDKKFGLEFTHTHHIYKKYSRIL